MYHRINVCVASMRDDVKTDLWKYSYTWATSIYYVISTFFTSPFSYDVATAYLYWGRGVSDNHHIIACYRDIKNDPLDHRGYKFVIWEVHFKGDQDVKLDVNNVEVFKMIIV